MKLQADESKDAEEKAESGEGEAEPAASVMDTTPWLKENPLPMTSELVENGQKYFGIYCSVCHGMNGGGNGLVNRRAQKILAATWIPPSSLHQDILYADKYPDGKLFNTISNGIRKDARLQLSDQGRRPLGHRCLRPRAAAKPKRIDRSGS